MTNMEAVANEETQNITRVITLAKTYGAATSKLLFALVVILLLLDQRYQLRKTQEELREAKAQVEAARTQARSFADMFGFIRPSKSSDTQLLATNTPSSQAASASRLPSIKLNPALPKDVFVQIALSDGGEPITVYKREAAALLKTIFRATRDPAQDRFSLQEVTDGKTHATLLLDRQVGNVWRLSRRQFQAVALENKPTVLDVNAPSGELIDQIIDRSSGYTLTLRTRQNAPSATNTKEKSGKKKNAG